MAKKTQKKSKKDEALHIEVIKQMVTLSTSGFGLIAALAWNNVVQELVDNYVKKFLPNGSGIVSLFLYALIITALAVLVTTQLSRLLERLEQRHQERS